MTAKPGPARDGGSRSPHGDGDSDTVVVVGKESVGKSALVAVYLAGVLLPCLVTAFTVAREVSVRWTATMMGRQAAAAIGFALCLAWLGRAVALVLP